MRTLAISLAAACLAAGPAGAREMVRIPVYFPVAESTLTSEAMAAVDEAAAAIKARGGETKILIAGSERPEPEGQDLVAARAQAIEDELVARGVARNSIRLLTTAGRTASIGAQPAIVSPADRRAEIIVE